MQADSIKLLHNKDMLPSGNISLNTVVEDASEIIVNKLVQQQKRLSTEDVSEIVDAYISGLTTYQLAKQFDCHRTTITYHLKAQGIKIRNRPLTKTQIDEAVRLYESGLSCLKIGKIIGANDTTILKRLRERGIRVRGRHERKNNLVLTAPGDSKAY